MTHRGLELQGLNFVSFTQFVSPTNPEHSCWGFVVVIVVVAILLLLSFKLD